MKIVIIGSGLIGVMSAYYLAKKGADVTVLERQGGVALETSFANAGIVAPGLSHPWNAPGVWRELLNLHSAFILRKKTVPSLLSWGMDFLQNTTKKNYFYNCQINAAFVNYNLRLLDAIKKESEVALGDSHGALAIFRKRGKWDKECKLAEKLASLAPFQALDTSETIELEPALASIRSQLAGAIYYPKDRFSNAYQFCFNMYERCKKLGVKFKFNRNVVSISSFANQIKGIDCQNGYYQADAYVLAAGSYSVEFAKVLRFDLPVRPVKGYSLSIPFERLTTTPPVHTIKEVDLQIALTPMDGFLRVTGSAEFAGLDTSLNPARLKNLALLTKRVYPNCNIDENNLITYKPWCGLRPMSSDGRPIISATTYDNLFVNTGHGPIGWATAAASGKSLANIIYTEQSDIDLQPFTLDKNTRRQQILAA